MFSFNSSSVKGFTKVLYSAFFITTLGFGLNSKAQTSDKVDIQNLEKKYWAAKDDDFSVVQNRTYSKAKRYFVSTSWGFPVNDPFSTGDIFQFDLGYYFSETYGISLTYSDGAFRNNETSNYFSNQHRIYPDNNKFNSSLIFNVMYVPFYAKMSVLEKQIIYFDMGASLGFGQNTYNIIRDNGELERVGASYQVNVFQQFFFSNHFAFRIDMTNRWTSEEQKTYSLSSNRPLGDKTINDTSMLFGLTYWH